MTASPDNVVASEWYYEVSYYDNPRSPHLKSVSYDLIHRGERADMGPVCSLDFDAYEAALFQMGFKKELEQYDKRGHSLGMYYLRGNVKVQVLGRRESDEPEAKRRHGCVKSIGISRAREQ